MRRTSLSPWVAALAGTAVVAAVAAAAPAPVVRKRLTALKAELDTHRAALSDLLAEERAVLSTLRALDKAVLEFEREGKVAEEQLTVLAAEAATQQKAAEREQSALGTAQAHLKKRLYGLYVSGEGGAVRHLLGAASFEDFAYRHRYLMHRAELDRALLLEVRARTRAAEEKAALADSARADAVALSAALAEQKKIVQLTQSERTQAMRDITENKALNLKAVAENVASQEAAQQELVALLGKVRRPAHKKGRGALKAGLLRPVSGAIFRDFGTVRDKVSRAKVTSNGIHIRAALGTPVRAPGDGTVVFTGFMRGFGQLVILDLGEKTHVLLGHLSRTSVARGDAVTRGQLVGLVGDTDSPEGAKLYLELRRSSRPINPARYLRAR